MKQFGFTRKILDDFQDLPLLLYFFVKIFDDFHDFVSECLFPDENQQPVLGSHRFSEEK